MTKACSVAVRCHVAMLCRARVAGRRQARRDAGRLETLKRERRRRRRRHARADAADGRPGLQLRRARLPGGRDVEVPDRHPREERLHGSSAASPACRRRGSATWGSGKPVIALGSDIDGIPQASQKPGVAYHDPIVAGAPGHGEGHNSGMPLQHHRGARREEDHGAREAAGHAQALARRRRGAARRQGVLRARRRVQGRRRRALRARRRQPRRVAGATATAPGWCRSSTRSRARARTRPARRGAAARRSTPSS